mmetsp:Transcript_15487/g.10859  ORF Transcript_15487/g.10859 Transcript_15487/m.10859 type:complete len:85 (-) Transcript_15487:646-900(-)
MSELEFDFSRRERSKQSETICDDNKYLVQDWKNGVLVLIPTRLGLNKIDKDYYLPILKFFECELNMGIIGGQPRKALYFVGCQK